MGISSKNRNSMDHLIGQIDIAVQSIFGQPIGSRDNPANEVCSGLTDTENKHSAGLMRVNQTGEVCAQALYQGQALVARNSSNREALLNAASQEVDHLVWCNQRLEELDSKPSILNPIFYASSLSIGALVGLLGDGVSKGFVEATEHQVCEHLEEHLSELPASDIRSRQILEKMREEEAAHGEQALSDGGIEFPKFIKKAMRTVSRLMTKTTYRF
ncbi:MAG: 2-polyprenyl-3-methyl-6-methoxy-1,4-benzoquinone monooxygenase [Gammaproteobacteria bacterium]|nr:2-polyprenyl-3-methyl-6-methoxy-1,4-benzoquinone monooxygenase [Gammaproteobacteria bacterium]